MSKYKLTFLVLVGILIGLSINLLKSPMLNGAMGTLAAYGIWGLFVDQMSLQKNSFKIKITKLPKKNLPEATKLADIPYETTITLV